MENVDVWITECVECGYRRPVWCGSDDSDATCQECISTERRRSAQWEAWDAYESGRPMSSDDY